MTLKTINKSLIEADTKYILHQCNCVTKDSAGIAKAIFTAFPWANTYSKRIKHSKQGTIDILGNGLDQRYVINGYIQYYPGKSFSRDDYENRLNSLFECLTKIKTIPDLTSIGIPVGMGCVMAGGDWNCDYLPILEDFAKQIKSEQNAEVILYNYDNKKSSKQESLWK
jgi:O-acetyl-ADP-ribose deacetylase (regulator of RNase III)